MRFKENCMHVTLVEINVHDDKVDEFIDVFRLNHLGSVREEGESPLRRIAGSGSEEPLLYL